MTDRIESVSVDIARITDKTCWVFVSVRSRKGWEGVGEASLFGREDLVVASVKASAGRLIGAAADPDRSPVTPSPLPDSAALSAIRQALWDLWARRQGLQAALALGGAIRASIPLYANINRRTRDRSPAGFAASARAALAAGHVAFKLAPFDEVTPEAHRAGTVLREAEKGLARAAAVCDAVGHGHDVMIDCHWRFDEASAVEIIRRAAEVGLVWIECPVPETVDAIPAIRRLRSLANMRGMRLAGCEELVGMDAFMPFMTSGACDVLMPDVKYAGGPHEMMQLAEAMSRHGVAFSPHNPSGPICHAHSLHVSAAAQKS